VSGGGAGGGPSGGSGTAGGDSAGGAGGGARGANGGGGGAALSASAAAEGGGTPQDPSSIHSENGFGSSQVPGVSEAAARTGAGVAAAHMAGSTAPTYLLIALIVLAATGMGLLTARHTRGERGRPQGPRA
jgi:hypothetical protein